MKPLTVIAEQSGCSWRTKLYEVFESGGKVFVKVVAWAEVVAVLPPHFTNEKEGEAFFVGVGDRPAPKREVIFGLDATLHYLEPCWQKEFLEHPPPWKPHLFRCTLDLEGKAMKRLSRELAPGEELFIECQGQPFDERQLYLQPRQGDQVITSQDVAPSKASATARRVRTHYVEINKIFWRAYIDLFKGNHGEPPGYKTVWDAVRNDVLNDPGDWSHREYDFHEIIEEGGVDPFGDPDPKLRWVTEKEQGTYRLKSLPGLLSRMKNNPPE